MKNRLFLAWAIVVTCSLSIIGQTKYVTSVTIEVQSKDKELAQTIESYIKREIRSLKDVEIVDQDGFHKIQIIAMKDTNVSGKVTGYTISMVVTWRATCITLDKRRPCYVLDDFLIDTGPMNDLRAACEALVVKFDQRSVENLRF
ncbi:MAG: hypothetical protein KF881_01990 [Acidobacteria bacterium]|nr:hypothetical protein [Acidobacteriota bacterium]